MKSATAEIRMETQKHTLDAAFMRLGFNFRAADRELVLVECRVASALGRVTRGVEAQIKLSTDA